MGLTPSILTERRQSLGLTQAELARILGVDSGTLSRWERGKQSITMPNMVSFALFGIAAARAIGAVTDLDGLRSVKEAATAAGVNVSHEVNRIIQKADRLRVVGSNIAVLEELAAQLPEVNLDGEGETGRATA